jgi:predicted HTH domain antitoxin
MSKSLNLEIPADVVDALRLPEMERMQRLRLELAVSLYAQGILGLGKAAHLADLSRSEMNRVLAQRQVPMRYGPEELAEDLHHGRGGQ